MPSKKPLVFLVAGAASAVLFAAFVPDSASAETNRRLCGAELAQKDGKAIAYMVAKVSKGDNTACDEAVNNKAPELLAQQIKAGAFPDPNHDNVTSNVRMATCESVFQDLGFPRGTDQCPGIEVSPDPQNVFPVLITRGD